MSHSDGQGTGDLASLVSNSNISLNQLPFAGIVRFYFLLLALKGNRSHYWILYIYICIRPLGLSKWRSGSGFKTRKFEPGVVGQRACN